MKILIYLLITVILTLYSTIAFGGKVPPSIPEEYWTGLNVLEMSRFLWEKPVKKSKWEHYGGSDIGEYYYDSANIRGPINGVYAVRTKIDNSETKQLQNNKSSVLYWFISCRWLRFYITSKGEISNKDKIINLTEINPVMRGDAVPKLALVNSNEGNLFTAICGEPSQEDISLILFNIPVQHPYWLKDKSIDHNVYQKTETGDGVDKHEDLKLYFPMNKGSAWIYDMGGTFYFKESVTDCMNDKDGIEVCTFSRDSGSLRGSSRYSYLKDAVIHNGEKLMDYEWQTEEIVLKSPLKIGGPIWENYYNENQKKHKTQNKVLMILPTMRVKAGIYNKVIVIESKQFTKINKKWKIDSISHGYYAPNVGLIGRGPELIGKLIQELVEYRPGALEK